MRDIINMPIGTQKGDDMTRKEFMRQAHLSNTWNRIHQLNGIKIAAVMWQSKPWKLIDTNDFDAISDGDDKSHVIAEFKYQEQLWEYVRDNLIAL